MSGERTASSATTDPAATDPAASDDTDQHGADQHGADIADLCFAARALAQTHPMTEPALRYRQQCFERERERQPVSELADWASTGLLVGYCIRRVEERETAADLQAHELDHDQFAERASALSRTLGSTAAAAVTLLPPDDAIAAIDRVIGTELDKRQEHLREQLDDDAWRELEEYVTWWVVHGYCVRAAET